MWWGIVTLTTVGYGDVSPVTGLGQLFGAITAVIGIGLVALPSGILAGGFIEAFAREGRNGEEKESDDEGRRCPHCGEPL
jgi:voltage-gated potassium channel